MKKNNLKMSIRIQNGNNFDSSQIKTDKISVSPTNLDLGKEKKVVKKEKITTNENKKSVNGNNDELKEKKNKLIMSIQNELENKFKEKRAISLKNSTLNGDYSYINASILCLSNLPDLLLYLQKNINYLNNRQKFPISYTFFSVIEHLFIHYPKKAPFVDSSRIIKIIKHCYPFLKICRNPVDLFSLLMQDINEKLKKKKKKKKPIIFKKDIDKRNFNNVIEQKIIDFNDSNESIISQLFNSFYKKEIRCPGCNNTFYDLQNFIIFDLDPMNTYKNYKKNIVTINDCLKYYVSPITSTKICSICNHSSKFVEKKNIFLLSNNLVFGINRNNSEQEQLMLKIKFNYEEILDISKYIDKKLVEIKAEYILIAVVAYFIEKKKFVAFCKNLVVDEWVYFDDDLINQCNYNYMINNSTPYLLFYKMLDDLK